MRVLFMGTPDIAAHILRAAAEKVEVVGLFCQPDKPVGRKAVLTPPPAKLAARELGIPVFQPERLRDGSAALLARTLRPDLIAVVAYGRILPPEILDIPPLGCVNIHVSLLPKYRGAAPIQHALLAGERETGVTAMYMAPELDAGDIIEQVTLPLTDEDDAGTVFARSAEAGVELLCRVMAELEAGVVRRTPQDHTAATYAPPLDKTMAPFSFGEDARTILNRVRGLSLWPVAEFRAFGRRVKAHKAALADGAGAPGEVLALSPLTVAARDGAVVLLEVKPEGSRLMSGSEWAAGRRLRVGDIIREEA